MITTITLNSESLSTTINTTISVATVINIGLKGDAAEQVNSDWNATSGASQILNKPTTFPPSAHTHSKAAVGLDNVDNTSDINKPISNATQTALNTKFNIPTGTTSQYVAGDGSLVTFPSFGTGSVTSVSVASANGFGGSVTNPSTTPQLTLTTSLNGLLKGDGTGLVVATPGTDYLSPTGSAAGLTGLTSGQVTTALGYTPYSALNPAGYTSNTGTVTTFTFNNLNGFTGVVSTAGTTPSLTLTLQTASSTQSGQLSSTDWNTFNNKQNALGFVPYNSTNPSGYTANSTDAQLRDRSTHTGTQLSSTISDFNTAVDARVVAGITGKENTIAAGLTSQYWRGDKTWQTLDKTSVGLSNVDNTSDANKPVSTATQTALNLKYDASNPSGYISANQTITFTGDATGSGNTSVSLTIPAATVTNAKMANMLSGYIKGRATAGTGAPEDLSTTQVKTLLSLNNVNNTSDANKPISTATQAALDTKYSITNPDGYSVVVKGYAYVDFGNSASGKDKAVVTVLDANVNSASTIFAQLSPIATALNSVDDYYLNPIQLYTTNIQDQTSFDIVAISRSINLRGTFRVAWIYT